MTAVFDDVLYAVCAQYGLAWWDCFDGDVFDTLTTQIAKAMNMSVSALQDLPDFQNWVCDAAMDL